MIETLMSLLAITYLPIIQTQSTMTRSAIEFGQIVHMSTSQHILLEWVAFL